MPGRGPMVDRRRWLALAAGVPWAMGGLAGCGGSIGFDGPWELSYRFDAEDAAWHLATTDYTVDTAPTEVSRRVATLPAPLSGAATVIGARNNSDDVFVYLRRRIDGLPPGALLEARFALTIAAQVPRGCVGVGGSPGESVYVKAGASTAEPVPVRVGDDILLSVDKGNQSQGGPAAVVLGDLTGAGIDCVEAPPILKAMPAATAVRLRAADDGSAWIFAGYDSGYESNSELWLVRLDVLLVRVD